MHNDEADQSDEFDPEGTQPLGPEADVIAATHAAGMLSLEDGLTKPRQAGYNPYDTTSKDGE